MREPCKAEKIAVMTAVKPKTSWKCSLGMLLLNRSREEPLGVCRQGARSSCKAFIKFLAHSSLQEHFVSSEMTWKGSAHMKKSAGSSCGFQEMQDSCHRLGSLRTTRNTAQTWMDAAQLLCFICYFFTSCVFVREKTILD